MTDAAKILIADDEQECIDFVREAFADSGHEVICAMDGEEALAVAQAQSPQLIILDIQMPKLDGFQVFAKLKADANLASVPVIMLTAVSQRTGVKFDSSDMGEYLGSEPDAYIDKPIEPVLLKQVANKLLKQAQQVHPRVLELPAPGPQQGAYEAGSMPNLSDLRGSASLEQLSNAVIALGRAQAEGATTAEVAVLKNRHASATGPAGTLDYDLATGRYTEITAFEALENSL